MSTAWICLVCGVACLAFACGVAHPQEARVREEKGKKIWRRTFQDVDVSPAREAALSKEVAPVMEMTREDLDRLLSAKATFYDLACPVCPRTEQQNNLGPLAKWTLADPFRITCPKCGTTFPGEKHPETAELKIELPGGKTQTYRYWPGPDGEQYFFTDAARQHLVQHLHGAAIKLGQLWLITGKKEYARKAVEIVLRYMEVYPDIPVHGSEGNEIARKKFVLGPPYLDWQCTKWGRYARDVIPLELVKAYDLLCQAPVFDDISKERGFDARAFIENGFRDSVRLSLLMVAGNDQILRTALCLGDPVLMHRAVRGVFEELAAIYCSDGLDPRGPAYHRPAEGYMSIVNSFVKGYSDPPGYRDLDDGLRYDDLDMSKLRPGLWQYLKESTASIRGRLAYPDGRLPPIHNAWPKDRWLPEGKRLERSAPQLLPGFGHAVLGRGEGAAQVQAHLHFSFLAGHGDADLLNIILFAEGREWLGEFGYSHGAYRAWASCALGHNTVVIDQKDQHYRRDGHAFGDLLLFVPATPEGLQFVEADGRRAYDRIIPDLKVYRRELVLVPAGPASAYVVDIFRVEGGRRHDWAAHASVGEPEAVEVDLPLEPIPGTLAGPDRKAGDVKLWPDEVRAERDSEYGLINELRAAPAENDWQARIRPENPAGGPSLRLYMPGEKGRQVVLGRAPNPRAEIKHQGSRLLLVRGQGPRSVFTAVWEPFGQDPFIRTVRRLPAEGNGPWDVGLEVQLADGRTHMLLSAPSGGMKAGPLALEGRFAFAEATGEKVARAVMVGGRRLTRNGANLLEGPLALEGEVLRSHGPAADEQPPALDVSGPLPLGTELAGQCLRVTHADGSTTGHLIQRVEDLGGGQRRVLVQDDPGYGFAWRNVAINEPTLPMLITGFLYTRASSPLAEGANSSPRRVIEGGTNTWSVVNVAAIR